MRVFTCYFDGSKRSNQIMIWPDIGKKKKKKRLAILISNFFWIFFLFLINRDK